MKKLSKTQTKEDIEEFFKDIENKNSKEVKKIKKIAMSKNIALKEKRKLFCKKCFAPYIKPKIRTKNKMKTLVCDKCGGVSRWKI